MVGWQECGPCQHKRPLSWRGCWLTDVTPAMRAPWPGPGNRSRDKPALSLHLDQAVGNWKKEEKPVSLEIIYKGKNRWGVGEREATQVWLREVTSDGCTGCRGQEGASVGTQRGIEGSHFHGVMCSK